VKLVTFEIACPTGPVRRIGALDQAVITDLNAVCAAHLQAGGQTGSPYELAAALVPSDMIAFLKAGAMARAAADAALTWLAAFGMHWRTCACSPRCRARTRSATR
jgi:hypothetical protein